MSEKFELPDYLKGFTDETARDMISVGTSVPRISIRGRQFRFIVDGEEVHKQVEPINVIILGVVPKKNMAKTFYIHGYQPGSTEPPDCSSFLGDVPDTWVEHPQADRCSDCPQNVWGSATSMSGKKAKACKDSKRLMVVKAEDLAEENPTLYIFNVTIASLKALTEYGKSLVDLRLPTPAVITSIYFVDAEFPQVDFQRIGVLNKEHGVKMLTRAQKEEWMDGARQLEAPAAKPQNRLAAPPPPSNAGAPDGSPNPPTPSQTQPLSHDEILDSWD